MSDFPEGYPRFDVRWSESALDSIESQLVSPALATHFIQSYATDDIADIFGYEFNVLRAIDDDGLMRVLNLRGRDAAPFSKITVIGRLHPPEKTVWIESILITL